MKGKTLIKANPRNKHKFRPAQWFPCVKETGTSSFSSKLPRSLLEGVSIPLVALVECNPPPTRENNSGFCKCRCTLAGLWKAVAGSSDEQRKSIGCTYIKHARANGPLLQIQSMLASNQRAVADFLSSSHCTLYLAAVPLNGHEFPHAAREASSSVRDQRPAWSTIYLI